MLRRDRLSTLAFLSVTEDWLGSMPSQSWTALSKYVNGRIHTNGLENFWSLLKRNMHGAYVSVEPFHLFRYLDEQTFRYNYRRNMNDQTRFEKLMGNVAGRRLTYSELTGVEAAM